MFKLGDIVRSKEDINFTARIKAVYQIYYRFEWINNYENKYLDVYPKKDAEILFEKIIELKTISDIKCTPIKLNDGDIINNKVKIGEEIKGNKICTCGSNSDKHSNWC